VVGGAAGDDADALGLVEDLAGVGAETLLDEAAVGDTPFEGVGDGAGLLVDLLEHVVGVVAEVGGVGGELALFYFALDDFALAVVEGDAVLADVGDVALFEEDEAFGFGQQGGDVGGDEGFVFAEADDQGGAFSGGDEAVGLFVADHTQGVGAGEFLHGELHGAQQVGGGFVFLVDLVDDDLGVGVGGEGVADLFLLPAQLLVVFDDAVVDDGNRSIAQVGMGVALARDAVGGPAGVGDAEVAADGREAQGFCQVCDLAFGAQALDVVMAVDEGDPGGVVAAVFEAF